MSGPADLVSTSPFGFNRGFSVAVGPKGEGPVVRNAESAHTLLDSTADGRCRNLHDCFLHGVALRPTAPCLGSRVRADGKVSTYEWQTYQQVRSRVDHVACGIWKKDLVPMASDGRRFFGFFLKNCRDWCVTSLACYKTGVVVVPMYDTLGPETVDYIQGQTTTSTVLCSASELPSLCKKCPFETVVVTGFVPKERLQQAEACKGFKLLLYPQLEALGKANASLLPSLPSPSPEDLALLCYTSGTTGDPKGAMLSHKNILAAIANAAYHKWSIFPTDGSGVQDVHISYLPLAHVFETVVINFCLYASAAVGFYQGDTLKLLEDLQALRPTVFVSVPRLYNRFYDKIVGGAKAKGGIAAKLFSHALSTKLEALHATGSVSHPLWDALVFSKVQKSLGLDRCDKMLCGSAPIAASVKDFLRVALGVQFVEGYGLSETAAATCVHWPVSTAETSSGWSPGSFALVPRLDPSPWSLALVPRLVPSPWSLALFPRRCC